MIGVMAEFERELIRERVIAGMRHARSRGIHVGRPRVHVDPIQVRALRRSGIRWREIAAESGVSVGTLYNKLR
jgi:DNA invertase Pin-like site-specific DNA recombinase